MIKKIPKATHEGKLKISGKLIPCAVLEDGTRVLSQAGFLRILGQTRRAKASNRNALRFLEAENLSPYIEEKLSNSLSEIEYRSLRNGRMKGVKAEYLSPVCEVFRKARRAGVLTRPQVRTAVECDLTRAALKRERLIEQIDRATGFEAVKDRLALEEILRESVAGELMAWAHRLPDEFFQELFRLKGWVWKGMALARPKMVGKYTNDLIFARLSPKVVKALMETGPAVSRRRQKATREPWITADIGHPALENHVFALLGLMRAAANWGRFHRLLQRSFPRRSGSVKLIGFGKGLEGREG